MATNNIKVESIDFDEDSNLKASFQIDGEMFHIEISGDEVKKIVPDMPVQSVAPATTEPSDEEISNGEASEISIPDEPTIASDSEFTKKYPIVDSVLKGMLPFLKSNAELYKKIYGIEGEVDDTIKQLLSVSLYDELTKRSEKLENNMSGGIGPAAGAGPTTIEEAKENLDKAQKALEDVEKEDIPDEEKINNAKQLVKQYEGELKNIQNEKLKIELSKSESEEEYPDDFEDESEKISPTDTKTTVTNDTTDNVTAAAEPTVGNDTTDNVTAQDDTTTTVVEEPTAIVVNPDVKLLKDILEKIRANKSSAIGMRSAHAKMGAKIYELVYFIIQNLALDTYNKFVIKYDEETEKFTKVYLDLQKKIQKLESTSNFNPSTRKYRTLKNQEKEAQDKYYRFLKDFKEHLNNNIGKTKFGDVSDEDEFEETVTMITNLNEHIESEFNKLDSIRISHTSATKEKLKASKDRVREKTKNVGKSAIRGTGETLRDISRIFYGGKTQKKRSGRGSRTTRKHL